MERFDLPDTKVFCPWRTRPTVADQALVLRRFPLAIEATGESARRVVAQAGRSSPAPIEEVDRQALQRRSEEEGCRIWQHRSEHRSLPEPCRVVLNPIELACID